MPYKLLKDRREFEKRYRKNYRKKNWKYIKKFTEFYREAWFARALDVLGRKCVICRNEDVRVLQFDHIFGNGLIDRKKGFIGWTLHKWIVTHPKQARKKYQILCANCNWIKAWERGEFMSEIAN